MMFEGLIAQPSYSKNVRQKTLGILLKLITFSLVSSVSTNLNFDVFGKYLDCRCMTLYIMAARKVFVATEKRKSGVIFVHI